jgi:hypothetical protein
MLRLPTTFVVSSVVLPPPFYEEPADPARGRWRSSQKFSADVQRVKSLIQFNVRT